MAGPTSWAYGGESRSPESPQAAAPPKGIPTHRLALAGRVVGFLRGVFGVLERG